MNISVRDFLGNSFNHGDYITIINNIPSNEHGYVYKTLWEGEFETIDHYIPSYLIDLNVVKWGIEKNSIIIYVDYKYVDYKISNLL